MSQGLETKDGSAPKSDERRARDTAFRDEIRQERSKIARCVESARVKADVPELLRLLAAEILLWTRELKMETLVLFEDTDQGKFARRMMRNVPEEMSILPGFIMLPFFVLQDARDVVELAVGDVQAKALINRFDEFVLYRRSFGEAISRLASVWDDSPAKHLEQLVTIDRHRSDVKHAAMDVCRFVDTLANFAAARSTNLSPRVEAVDPTQSAIDVSTPSDHLRSLRQVFDQAVAKLDSLPDTELSPSGQPFIEECSKAMLAFAAWFGEQTPDDLPLWGNAHRIYYALGGLSGVIDWVAFRWSVPFSKELDDETAKLVEEADALHKAVVDAFKLPSEPHVLRVERKPLSDDAYQDLEDRISSVSWLAFRLGSRLQRLAVWASGSHSPKVHASAQRRPMSLVELDANGSIDRRPHASDSGGRETLGIRNADDDGGVPSEAGVGSSSFQITETAFEVRSNGLSHRFTGRSTKLFALLARIARRPGHRVQFDSLRALGDVWDGCDVDDSTIRGAVKRLKDRLRGAGMSPLADRISTGTFENRQYVILASE